MAHPGHLQEVEITHPERVIFSTSGYTKGDLADYYAAIAPLMLPFAANRPMSLVRCPKGTAENCFFQKHLSGGFDPQVHPISIEEKSGDVEDYLYVDDAAGIIACVQMGAIEFHGWGSLAEDIESPERLVFDLDPGKGVPFPETRNAARDIRKVLETRGLVSFTMLTGGKGIHVIVPLNPGHNWTAHHAFAKDLARQLAEKEPDRFTATVSKKEREGRIFIDWLRNTRGATAIMPYSVRARTGAPIAVPVSWEELDQFESAASFTIAGADKLIERAASPELAGWGFADQGLPKD